MKALSIIAGLALAFSSILQIIFNANAKGDTDFRV
jgi:hypothetical protein